MTTATALRLNPHYDAEAAKLVNRRGDFMPHPYAYVDGPEGVLALLEDQDQLDALVYPRGWLVKCDWLCDLIGEIEASGDYPYNHVVKRLARERLGLPALSERENDNESDALSRLIYNARVFRHSDQHVDGGYEPLTDELVQRAYDEKRVIEFQDGRRCRVRDVDGKLYVFAPRKRRWAVAVQNQAVKLS